MSPARLTTRFWVDAYLARLRLADIPAFVVRHGDDDAGAVWVKQSTLDGAARVYQRQMNLETGGTDWVEMSAGPETEIDALCARERDRDRDLWVIEVEDRAGRHLLDEPGLDG